MEKKYLMLGVHNHQPAGNFDYVLEHAFESCYKPFIDVIKKYPKIKINIHFSGWLLEWLQKKHRKYLEEISELVKDNRIEVFAGGFYEPILPIFPQEDRIIQIEKLKNKVMEIFGAVPKGLWLAERVWEQELVKTLNLTGMSYLPLDDSHFELSGIERSKLEGYYISEYEGYTIAIFPINRELRYMIPFDTHERIIEYIKHDVRKFFTFFDDGEKFGIWPGTFEHVYKNGWLEKFMELISKSEWLETLTFSEFFEKFRPSGRVYIPSSSYSEMLEWSLPSKLRSMLEKGKKVETRYVGNWRNFLLKYPEANLMHKKILYVRSKFREKFREIREQNRQVLDSYLKSQANDAFWHGLFGGIYLPHLRKAVYENIMIAENELHRSNGEEIDILDFDCDGTDEILFSNQKLNLYVDPDYGGRIFELDLKDKKLNLLNTIARHYEPYHDKLRDSVELAFDWYERFSLIDHFFGDDTSLENFSKVKYEELGDFVNQPFEYEVSGDKIITLFREGHVWFGEKWLGLKITKSIEVSRDIIKIDYKILNTSREKLSLWYGCELNFSLLSDKNGRYIKIANEKFEPCEVKEIQTNEAEIFDEIEDLKVDIILDREMNLWSFPIYTISYSEVGPEKIFQSLCVVPNVKFELQEDKMFEFKLTLKFKDIQKSFGAPH